MEIKQIKTTVACFDSIIAVTTHIIADKRPYDCVMQHFTEHCAFPEDGNIEVQISTNHNEKNKKEFPYAISITVYIDIKYNTIETINAMGILGETIVGLIKKLSDLIKDQSNVLHDILGTIDKQNVTKLCHK